MTRGTFNIGVTVPSWRGYMRGQNSARIAPAFESIGLIVHNGSAAFIVAAFAAAAQFSMLAFSPVCGLPEMVMAEGVLP